MEDRLTLDRYRLISEAGSGGFATVQLAWDTVIKRRVAIKRILLEAQATARIDAGPTKVPGLEEARTAALLSDAAIVGVYDFAVDEGSAYLIMEYVDGMSLGDVLREANDDVDADVVAAVLAAVARALEVAHGNQVLHLDVKPDNVLITRQGQVKVADFGLSRLSDAAGFGAAGGGTIGYMPLEQMRREPLDQRCDEWALASIVYEMIAGENPFWARSMAEAERAIEEAELVLPSLCMDGVDQAADDVVFCALDPDREERYPTVSEFADELEPCLGDARRGQKKLAKIVARALADDGEEEGEEPPHRQEEPWRLLDHVPIVPWDGVVRAFSVLGATALSWLALENVPQVGGVASPAFWGVLAAVAVVGALVPHAGAVASLALLVAALLLNAAPVPAAVVAIGGVVWWWTFGRFGKEQAAALLTPASAGAVSFALVTPFVVGGMMRPRYAAVGAAWALGLAVVLAGFGSQALTGWDALAYGVLAGADVNANVLAILARPATWGIAAGWMAAALIVSWAAERDTLLGVLFGSAGGMLALVGGIIAGTAVDPLVGGFANGLPLCLAACSAGIGGMALGLLGRRFVSLDE